MFSPQKAAQGICSRKNAPIETGPDQGQEPTFNARMQEHAQRNKFKPFETAVQHVPKKGCVVTYSTSLMVYK